ncbi:hydrophobic surface binding protein A-domain-containing protein [Aspergillus unguis]
MKLSNIVPALALLAPALANPIQQRDIAAIKEVLTNINTQVTALDTAINAQPIDPPSIVKKADALADTIRQGTTSVNSQDQLNDIDALGLVSPTQTLADNTETSIQDLIDKRSKIDDLGKGCVSLQSLQELNSAAKELSSAIVSKVPESLNSIASNLSSKISSAIQKGVDAYQGECDEAATQTQTETQAATQTATQTQAQTQAQTTQATATQVPQGVCKARK